MNNYVKSNTHQSPIVDLVKLIGLIVVTGIAVFDVFWVRSQNKTLKKTLETQTAKMESKLNSVTEKRKNCEQALRNAEQLTSDVKTRAKEKESELTGRIEKMEEAHRKELEEQRNEADKLRASFENKMRKMEENFNREKEQLQAELRSLRESRALAQRDIEEKRPKDRASDRDEKPQAQPKQSIAELKNKIKANQEEVKSLRMENPGCILVDHTKQARILETRFRPNGWAKYMFKDQITYVRSLFRCTACNWEGSELGGPCCDVSRKRSYGLWRKAFRDAQKTEQINARIDELLKENEDLKKATQR